MREHSLLVDEGIKLVFPFTFTLVSKQNFPHCSSICLRYKKVVPASASICGRFFASHQFCQPDWRPLCAGFL